MVNEEGTVWRQLGTLGKPGDWERKRKMHGMRYGLHPASCPIRNKIFATLLGHNAV
jgi:hypothetical protein